MGGEGVVKDGGYCRGWDPDEGDRGMGFEDTEWFWCEPPEEVEGRPCGRPCGLRGLEGKDLEFRCWTVACDDDEDDDDGMGWEDDDDEDVDIPPAATPVPPPATLRTPPPSEDGGGAG